MLLRIRDVFMMEAGRKWTYADHCPQSHVDILYSEFAQRVKPSDGLIKKVEN